MNDPKKPDPSETAAPETPPEQAAPDEMPDLMAPDAVEEAFEGVFRQGPAEGREAALEAEVANLKDQTLRALAEAENARRRAQKDREEAARYGAVPLIKDLLGVADNLERALAAAPEESEGPAAALRAGVEMTRRELAKAFEKHKVERLEPIGEKLDPHRHEALFEMPHEAIPAGHVAQVLEAGYLLHDRLIRPARVGVSTGPAAGAAPAPEAPGSRVDTKA